MRVPEIVLEEIGERDLESLRKNVPGDAFLQKEAEKYKTLSSPIRLKILYLLYHGPLCVCIIKDLTGTPDSKLSYHLNTLKEAGLIEGKQRQSWIIYNITKEGISLIG